MNPGDHSLSSFLRKAAPETPLHPAPTTTTHTTKRNPLLLILTFFVVQFHPDLSDSLTGVHFPNSAVSSMRAGTRSSVLLTSLSNTMLAYGWNVRQLLSDRMENLQHSVAVTLTTLPPE